MKIGPSVLAQFPSTDPNGDGVRDAVLRTFAVTKPMPGVVPKNYPYKLAMDEASTVYSYAAMQAVYAEGLQFMGYPYLAELTQRAEYRRPAEILAKEMTRKWIKLQATGDDSTDKGDKIKAIDAELDRLNAQKVFREAIEQDGFFGRAQIYIDLGHRTDDEAELKTPLPTTRTKINKRRRIKRLTLIEAIWTYPNFYNANDPLDPTFFKPQSWFVMGKEIHATRFFTIVSRKVPDILKPAYAFGGLSLSQMMKPYVDNWLRTRQSVSDLLHSFSCFSLGTNLANVLNQGAGDELLMRAELFNKTRDNKGLQIYDKDTEVFSNVAAPMGGLDHLQAQSQEHMAAVSGLPIIKLLGITPSGLNASSDGELRSFYDWIAAQQEGIRTHVERLIKMIQLYLFEEIDPEISFMFQPLWALDEAQLANVRKTEAETDGLLIDKGIIDPGESRARIAGEEDSPYANLDLNKEIVSPDQANAEAGIGDPNADPNADPYADADDPTDPRLPPDADGGVHEASPGAKSGSGGLGGEAAVKPPPTEIKPKGAHDEAPEFKESNFKRDEDGKFAGGAQTHKKAGGTGEKRTAEGGGDLPAHIASLKIPPAWTDVTYTEDPHAALLVTGRDAKGRAQHVYSQAHHMAQAAAKFARIKELSAKFDKVLAQNEEARKSKDPKTKDAADALRLIMMTGIRPGSEEDTKAAAKAYGATTLEGRHVIEKGHATWLRFVGKKGVKIEIPVDDAETAALLRQRKASAGAKGQLFPSVSRSSLLAHTHSMDGGGFKTKDFRTLLATRTATAEVEKGVAPKTEKEYKKAVKAVATIVSKRLGNTPTIALQSYINPAVFAAWRSGHAG